MLIDASRDQGMFMVFDDHGVEHFLDFASGVVLRHAALALGPRHRVEAVGEGLFLDEPVGRQRERWIDGGEGVDAARLVHLHPVLLGQPMCLVVRPGDAFRCVRRLTGRVLHVERCDEPPWVTRRGET
ncbi:hypothetical protein ABKW28_04980 [Nocardioides sp. 31GB23]|uniref:hypothetical protein n=1 Tax=Nocardioides sp. 31GB23 TaxID=3156065 RepID=UPI0032AEAE36